MGGQLWPSEEDELADNFGNETKTLFQAEMRAGKILLGPCFGCGRVGHYTKNYP